MNILKNVTDSYKKSPVKFIAVSLLLLLGLIFAWYITLPLIVVVYLGKKFKKDEYNKKDTKKKCPHCKTEIDWLATRCPSCHGKMYVWTADKKIVTLVIAMFFLIGVIKISSSPSSTSSVADTPSPTVSQTPAQNSVSKAEAQKELDDLITLGKKANLVTSYEFSDSASVVYIDTVWYTQTVQFKKDFIAKVGMLKEAITGYSHFEVRDAYSNEKVGEITAFTSSIEVYK